MLSAVRVGNKTVHRLDLKKEEMMKRTIAGLLCGLMLLTVSGGCGTPAPQSAQSKAASMAESKDAGKEMEKTDAPVEITYCYWGGAVDAKARGDIAALYNTTQDKVIVKPIPIDNASYVTKMQAFFAAGNEPDVIQSSADYGEVYIAEGKLADLTGYVEASGLKDYFVEYLLDEYTYDGKIYALPFSFNTMLIAYNKSIFDAKGVSYPSENWTEKDFLDAAKQLTYGEGNEKVWGLLQGWSTPTILADMYGESIFDIENRKLHAADNQAFIDGFRYMADLVLTEGVSPDKEHEAAAGGGLVTGRFAMELSAVWSMEDYSKTMTDGVDLARFPVSEKYGRWHTPVSNVGFYISENSQKKDAAWDFIQWTCTSREAQIIMESSSLPASKEIINDKEYLKTYPENWIAYDKTAALDFSSVSHWPLTAGVWAKLMSELTSQWEMVMNREKTVDAAIADFQSIGDQVLAKESKS